MLERGISSDERDSTDNEIRRVLIRKHQPLYPDEV